MLFIMIKSYAGAVGYLEALIPDPKGRRLGNMRLERIEHLLRIIGNPEKSFQTIHIGGTSGKGSTAYLAASILKEAGYRTGLHISPHLEKINERMQVDERPISDSDFLALVGWIRPFVEQVGREGEFGTPSYFEVLVALSFEYFKRKKVEVAVVEVGLGGMYDATNVIKPRVAVITNIGLDHTEILGNTAEKIARDKAGIIKEGVVVITAAKQKSVLDIMRRRCKEKRARLFVLGRDFKARVLRSDFRGLALDMEMLFRNYRRLASPLLGRHQAENIACAVSAVEALNDFGFYIKKKAVKEGLFKCRVPGRLEVFNIKGRRIVLDGAHNPEKIKALTLALKDLFLGKKITFVMASKKNKDINGMLKKILPLAEKVVFTEFSSTTDFGRNQSMPAEELGKTAKRIKKNLKIETARDAREAIERAIGASAEGRVICITGSLYLVGEARELIRRKFQKTNFK